MPYKFTPEQRKEVAILANAGVPRARLAEAYGMSVHYAQAISQRRAQFVGEENVARSPKETFVYAQHVYRDQNTSEAVRQHLENTLFRPLAGIIVQFVRPELYSGEGLMRVIFGLPHDYGQVEARQRQRAEYALNVLKKRVMQGQPYDTIDQAVESVPRDVEKLEEENLPSEEKQRRAALKEKVDKVLNTLDFREREIIKLRYGLGDGSTYTLEEVGKVFKIDRERVRQIEARAVQKLQHPIRMKGLEGFLQSANR